MRVLVLFDFDGTLTKQDTLLSFIRFYHGRIRFISGLLVMSPFLLGYKLKLIKNWKAKEKVLVYFFKGEEEAVFNQKCTLYCKNVLPGLLRGEAMDKLISHKKENHHIIVVSASAENWILPWTNEIGVELIGTKLEFQEQKLTGKILGKNCYGPEKAARIQGVLQLQDYSKIIAYGDSRGDREMLNLATEPMFRKFS